MFQISPEQWMSSAAQVTGHGEDLRSDICRPTIGSKLRSSAGRAPRRGRSTRKWTTGWRHRGRC